MPNDEVVVKVSKSELARAVDLCKGHGVAFSPVEVAEAPQAPVVPPSPPPQE